MKKKANRLSRKDLIIGAVLVIVLGGVIGALAASYRDYTPDNAQTITEPVDPEAGSSPIDEVDVEETKQSAPPAKP